MHDPEAKAGSHGNDGRGAPTNLSAAQVASRIAETIAARSRADEVVIVGFNGAQGAGKSTLVALVADSLARTQGQRVASLSLDDFYLTRAEREQLARQVHPLCQTRGVPGTHDVALLSGTLDRLATAAAGQSTELPRFDKLADDRAPPAGSASFVGRPNVILLEGWCVGMREADLPPYAGPINALERSEDPQGTWFHWSRQSLAAYAPVWDRLDLLVSIEVPDLETVIDSRLRQEDGLAAGSRRPRMDRDAVIRFVAHYERYTRALWAAMPARADLLFRRNRDFDFASIKG